MIETFRKSVLIAAMAIGAALVVAAHGAQTQHAAPRSGEAASSIHYFAHG